MVGLTFDPIALVFMIITFAWVACVGVLVWYKIKALKAALELAEAFNEGRFDEVVGIYDRYGKHFRFGNYLPLAEAYCRQGKARISRFASGRKSLIWALSQAGCFIKIYIKKAGKSSWGGKFGLTMKIVFFINIC